MGASYHAQTVGGLSAGDYAPPSPSYSDQRTALRPGERSEKKTGDPKAAGG